jgi:hypothetical protein
VLHRLRGIRAFRWIEGFDNLQKLAIFDAPDAFFASGEDPIRSATMITIDMNGTQHQIEIEQDTPLRDVVGLTGTKFGCGMAACGCCTAHIGVGG